MPDSRPRLTAMIAEDEPMLGEELREGLEALWPELEVEAIATDGAAALREFERCSPSIAFLDIQMPRIDGLDVARRIGSRAHIVFITAYDHHALQAFDAGAVDYVLKPLQLGRLAITVQRLKERIGKPPADLESTLRAVTNPAPSPRRHLQWINASRASGIRMIMVDDVCYFKADNKYTLVIEEDSESVIRKTIKELVDELDPGRFWQVHRSTLVNVTAIETVVRDDSGGMFLKLKNRPERLAVSTQYHSLFRQM
jgi:DNA-binding LytR/AlgR family response regulator